MTYDALTLCYKLLSFLHWFFTLYVSLQPWPLTSLPWVERLRVHSLLRVQTVYQNLSEIEQFAAELGLWMIPHNFAVSFCRFCRFQYRPQLHQRALDRTKANMITFSPIHATPHLAGYISRVCWRRERMTSLYRHSHRVHQQYTSHIWPIFIYILLFKTEKLSASRLIDDRAFPKERCASSLTRPSDMRYAAAT